LKGRELNVPTVEQQEAKPEDQLEIMCYDSCCSFRWILLLLSSILVVAGSFTVTKKIKVIPCSRTEGKRTFESLFLKSHESNDNDHLDELSRALLQQSSRSNPLEQLVSPHKTTEAKWYEAHFQSSSTKLPFECTACGKCCQTKGEVYLNPTETRQAASLLSLPLEEFKTKFVAREEETSKEHKWTVLKQKNIIASNGEKATQCVFLNEEMQCGIYGARPLQCSTYPFWPRIMDEIDGWNDEVVEKDENELFYVAKKQWTYDEGGCEGMKTIGDDSIDFAKDEGFTLDAAIEQLEMYKRYKRRFPYSSKFQDMEES